ncbi:hypothetical protein B0A78_01755 [Flavobacterium columnare NBRC 100251 = ATCC 23463]|uniref:hypothetical protein n=1 Tax=Flavobacterium columnare TaxID=996 RepID=UPI0007F9A732|nr:hypothetical protein [Flavobacterium columnare]ANO47365.1 hypothetical protein Pf1_01910 [Flavobacterium columnare]APT21979.1 hypothetical protein BU993_04585 [Flavobacterium columnare]MBF6656395.1 hypothetical protein [Flavobacterium columnare]OOB82969.1 hypothetical protein BZL53_08440 [Flavobacterium columnare]PDS26635.1 hypothetical protein B0A78_01755 [Flavobacterium columnare NBRC 100251 = ATCC 23463]
MKKIMILCLVLALSNTFAQEAEMKSKKLSKSKAVVEKLDKVKEATKAKKESRASVKGNVKSIEGKAKAEANKLDSKAKDEENKAKSKTKKAKDKIEETISKPAKKERETTEKVNPNAKDKVVGKYKDRQVYQGPRGGNYYINKNGNKTYIDDDQVK